MKYLIALYTLCFFSLTTFAQQEPKQFPRTIEVTGSAEMEIEPDEVYLSVTLKEYMKDKTKITIAEIDKEFMAVLTKAKIDLKDVSVSGAHGYYDYEWWRNRYKKTDFMAAKTYIIKLPNLDKYNQLMGMLDNKGIENAYLQRTDNSKIEEYRQQVKINALKAAKGKAKLMVESIGNQLGDVVFIREINDGNVYRPVMYKNMANMAMDAESSSMGGGDPSITVQKITIRYEVEAHFVIK